MLLKSLYGIALLRGVAAAAVSRRQTASDIDSCPGYSASDVINTDAGLTARLSLAGPACNAYGADVQNLRLAVNYDSSMLLGSKQIKYRLTHSRKAITYKNRG